jgi:hypothetical protein
MAADASQITSGVLANGEVIREPVGKEAGYWVGSPNGVWDASDRAWYLTYRIRRPRGVQPDRGGEVRIASSTDLREWKDVVTISKDSYNSASIERSCLIRGKDRLWRYFTSYVDPENGRWCVAVLKAPTVAQLDPSKREVVFTAGQLKLEGVKDPWIIESKGPYYLFMCVATPTAATKEESHGTLDIFNTGQCVAATGLATSTDLEKWSWQGVVFQPERTGWDCYCRRINSVIPVEGGHLAFYDGIPSEKDNYEEKTGLAFSEDLRTWKSFTADGPRFESPYASGALRYMDAQPTPEGRVQLFYEFARQDGAHDLRTITVTQEMLQQLLRDHGSTSQKLKDSQ